MYQRDIANVPQPIYLAEALCRLYLRVPVLRYYGLYLLPANFKKCGPYAGAHCPFRICGRTDRLIHRKNIQRADGWRSLYQNRYDIIYGCTNLTFSCGNPSAASFCSLLPCPLAGDIRGNNGRIDRQRGGGGKRYFHSFGSLYRMVPVICRPFRTSEKKCMNVLTLFNPLPQSQRYRNLSQGNSSCNILRSPALLHLAF